METLEGQDPYDKVNSLLEKGYSTVDGGAYEEAGQIFYQALTMLEGLNDDANGVARSKIALNVALCYYQAGQDEYAHSVLQQYGWNRSQIMELKGENSVAMNMDLASKLAPAG
ncbi:hypothetical protein [Streptacidiphilus rugosus]|uniref:hypothetical protein n=1 Tax=Streptacidiphilus rugosus TaxID=405783 RepID=UPI0012FC397B|nr:hypothetical protein [Streptacidiphilus rugosus]